MDEKQSKGTGSAGQIEATLKHQAQGILARLKETAGQPGEADFMMEWHKLGALLELVYAPGSGISGSTIVELAQVDKEAAEIFNAREKDLAGGGAGKGSGERVLN